MIASENNNNKSKGDEYFKNFSFTFNEKLKKIENDINNMNRSESNFFNMTVFEVSMEINRIIKNKNKIVLQASNDYLNLIFEDQSILYSLFESIGINKSGMKSILKRDSFIIIEFESQELKLNALRNGHKIRNFQPLYGKLYVNDCLTQRQRLNAKILRDQKKSLNSQLPYYRDNCGHYGVDDETHQEFYFGIRSGLIKKIIIKPKNQNYVKYDINNLKDSLIFKMD